MLEEEELTPVNKATARVYDRKGDNLKIAVSSKHLYSMPLMFDAVHTERRRYLAGQAVFWDTVGVSRTLRP